MDVYELELEPAGPDGFAAMVPAVPVLLILGSDVDETLRRVRVAIASCEGCGLFPIQLDRPRLSFIVTPPRGLLFRRAGGKPHPSKPSAGLV